MKIFEVEVRDGAVQHFIPFKTELNESKITDIKLKTFLRENWNMTDINEHGVRHLWPLTERNLLMYYGLEPIELFVLK